MYSAYILPLFLGLRGPQLIFIAIVVLLLFGAGRIPAIMRNLGKGIYSFKQGLEDAKQEINREVKKASPDDSGDSAKADDSTGTKA